MEKQVRKHSEKASQEIKKEILTCDLRDFYQGDMNSDDLEKSKFI